ncbi:MFS transporter [Hydrogenibacillus schlegelii]|uniref:MFS transporter n=1 Tax=Hydrogenibacillus schlegelii TaxID=1484 RepID=UPI0008266C0F|nr:MFS transporter [Hydrogenibacillus schlegelii]
MRATVGRKIPFPGASEEDKAPAKPATAREKGRRDPAMFLWILLAISLAHLFNDSMQAVIPAVFPILRENLALDYVQLGWVSFALYATASVLQPVIGLGTDRRPLVYLLPTGMLFSLAGMVTLASAREFHHVLLAVLLVGLGSAVFHPEASRVAHLASGPRRGLGQSIFQVGGNAGQSLAPLLSALIFVPFGQRAALYFALPAAAAAGLMLAVAAWRKTIPNAHPFAPAGARGPAERDRKTEAAAPHAVRHRLLTRARWALLVLVAFVFLRSWYHVGMSNFYAFYLIERSGLPVQRAQLYLFLFLAAGALGTLCGGPLADRFGRKTVLVFSMVGASPFALLLPHAGPALALAVMPILGFIVFSSFSVSVLYAQELFPGHVGAMSGLVIGLAFGMGAVGAVAVGAFIEHFGITLGMQALSVLPLLGTLAFLLPSDRHFHPGEPAGRLVAGPPAAGR